MSPSPPKLLKFELDPRRCLAPAGRPPLPPTPTPITSGPSASTSDQSSVLMLLIALAHESERVCPPPPRRRLASGQACGAITCIIAWFELSSPDTAVVIASIQGLPPMVLSAQRKNLLMVSGIKTAQQSIRLKRGHALFQLNAGIAERFQGEKTASSKVTLNSGRGE